MARIIQTEKLGPGTRLSVDDNAWVYNGLDCCVTLEVRNKLIKELERHPPNVRETYETAMRKYPAVNYMCIKGLRVDKAARDYAIRMYKKDLAILAGRFNYLCTEILGYSVNWRSPTQLKALFGTAMGIKLKKKRNANGDYMPSTNADALEAIKQHPMAGPYASHILAMRETGKKISFLETEMDDDGRMRTSLNIAGTDTGRFASSGSSFGTGSNLQNVEDRNRAVFVADDGKILVNVDLEQADSRGLGARLWELFYDKYGPEAAGKYLDACESGDLHTRVCQMAWQELKWPDDNDLKLARKVADALFYRDNSYRDMAKRLGHGTNFFGTPRTMAMHTKTETGIIQNFQRRYFGAFPLIGNYDHDLSKDDWHGWVHRQLRDVGSLTTLFGRRRIFFDRYNDDNTLRAAIAYEPQSCTGEFLDRGWLNLWDNMPEAELLMPVHDSILFQIPYEGLHELIPRALELLKVTLELKGGRLFSIPLEAQVGFNWAKARYDEKTGLWENPNGLKKWTGTEERQLPKPKGTRLKHFLS